MSARSVAELIDEGNALEEQGRTAEAMSRYQAALEADPRCARAHLNRGNVLLAGGQINEARVAYELAIGYDPQYAAGYFNLGNLSFRTGDYERALHQYRAAIGIKPDFVNAYVAIGNALDALGRTAEARASYERALSFNPRDPGANFNLGILATTEGLPEQAAASLRRAVEAWPEFAAAHRALGRVLSSLGQLEAAEASLRRASSLAPESDDFLYDLAMVLMARGKNPEAVQLTMRRLERAPTWSIKSAFAECVSRTRFLSYEPQIRAPLTAAITEAWAAPYQLCAPALSLIMLDSRIANGIRLVNEAWPTRVTKSALVDAQCLAALAADPLVHALLEATPVSSIDFERLLTALRQILLEIAMSDRLQDPADIQAAPLYAALARQCFINEYVFDCDERERRMADACRARLLTLLDASAQIPLLLLLAVAAYFPLFTLPDPRRLLATGQQSALDSVLREQIAEPLEEQALRASIDRLTPISGGVSEDVRNQYEENPYPRWVKLPLHEPDLRFNDALRRAFPLAHFARLPDDSQIQVLIAGCGTGSQPIISARRYLGAHILAVDLSLSSITYAMRKTRELRITNIDYAQADILKLGELPRTFDVIGAVGVLHHLADPFEGWRILVSRLRPGGFMKLGFYSQLARRHVVRVRELIAARGYASTADDIRRLRRDLAASGPSAELQMLSNTPDYYSTSECRDLLFHVQEHRLTLDQIGSFLAESGLQFIGFELDPRVLHQYHTRFPGDVSATDLRNWTRFETDNPDTFAAMYQFWVQKPLNH